MAVLVTGAHGNHGMSAAEGIGIQPIEFACYASIVLLGRLSISPRGDDVPAVVRDRHDVARDRRTKPASNQSPIVERRVTCENDLPATAKQRYDTARLVGPPDGLGFEVVEKRGKKELQREVRRSVLEQDPRAFLTFQPNGRIDHQATIQSILHDRIEANLFDGPVLQKVDLVDGARVRSYDAGCSTVVVAVVVRNNEGDNLVDVAMQQPKRHMGRWSAVDDDRPAVTQKDDVARTLSYVEEVALTDCMATCQGSVHSCEDSGRSAVVGRSLKNCWA